MLEEDVFIRFGVILIWKMMFSVWQLVLRFLRVKMKGLELIKENNDIG